MRVGTIIIGIIAASLLAPVVQAVPPAAGAADRVDPLLRDAPPPSPSFADGADLPVLLRPPARTPWGPDLVDELAVAGVILRLGVDDGPVDIGGIRVADGPRDALRDLAERGWSVRVARSLASGHLPTAVTGPLSELDSLVASGPSPVDGPLGAGMTVLDVDSSIDPFHPHFFRADAGVKVWFDADGDGVLTPGIDGVDRDRDGALAPDEILQLANSRQIWTDVGTYRQLVEGDDDLLDPARDWLWLDENGNGVRDYGPDAGFDDGDAAFGERIYVPDDVDGDGVIRVPERLFQLGSSRIAAVSIGSRVYRRGEDLTDLFYLPGYRFDHGTGVGGALVGGQLYPQPRPRGLLPEADLYMFDHSFTDEAEQVEALDAALADGVDVVLWEYGRWVGEHLDGSSLTEQAIDAMSEQGVVQVCPAGNLATSGKHGVSVAADGRFAFHFRVPSYGSYEYLWLDLHLDSADADLTCELTPPSGLSVPVVWNGDTDPIGDMVSDAYSWVSPRDTTMWTLTMYSGVLQPGTWVLRCEDAGGDDRMFHAFLSDGTSWGRATRFLQEEDLTTLCLPSTADSCISVAAFGGDQEYWDGELPGERHLYSSMGPRLDRGKTIDVAAPADPFVPSPLLDDEDGATHPVYRRFGGTSGAGPHVAAAALLLRELYPEATASEIRQMLRDGARVDEQVAADDEGLPGHGWGYGKLSSYQAAFGELPPSAPPAPRPVTVELQAWIEDERCVARATGGVQGDAPAIFRWDLNYDGTWDSEFSPEPYPFEVAADEVVVLRGQAAVDGWWVGGSSLIWRAPDPCPKGPSCGGCSAAAESVGVGWLLPLLLLASSSRRRR